MKPTTDKTIIERDIEFYQACYETYQHRLRKCVTDQELMWTERMIATQAVLRALKQLQVIL